MALTRQFAADRDKQVRRRADGSTKQGDGDDRHILFGEVGSGDSTMRYRSLIRFDHNWSGVKRVVKAEIVIKTEDDSSHFAMGSKPAIRAARMTETFSDGSNGENVWTSGEYEWPGSTGAADAKFPINPSTGLPQDAAIVSMDVTALIKAFVPKTVLMPDGTAGLGLTNYGWVLRAVGETDNNQRGIAFSRHHPTAGNRPYLLLTYDPVNQKPTAPSLTAPATDNNTFGDSFEGTHHDPDLDPMVARNIEVWKAGETGDAGKSAVWTLPANLQSAASDESQTGIFSVPLALAIGSLKLGTAYEWRAQTKDAGGWGAFSAVRALRITSSAPAVVATPFASVDAMQEVLFGGEFSDPDGDRLAKFIIQMQAVSAHTDVAFGNPAAFVWTTGEALPTADEVESGVIARLYAGKALDPGDYTYRIRVQDDSGVWSAWSYDDFTLTTEYNTEPGDPVLTTQVGRIPPVRIALYGMGTLRGIGALIGHVDDPVDLGGSAFLNGVGEVYWSLPALHPYVPSIEPHRTHYAVEQYVGDRYIPRFAGIVTDFDADPESVTFYGTDYLGLLQTAVDERYNPSNARLAADGNGGGGSYYSNKSLDFIIKDQLRYHKGLSNSPVGFITLGTMTALAEKAQIYSTYTEALPFLTGLIDSHKQGTGRECRLYARPKDSTFLTWEWALIDNWGKDRTNIRLEYGGLLNDFRVVALGDFGTRILGVGQKRGESKVYRAQGPKAPITGLPESDWGRRAQTRFYPDIIDQADLQRRVNEDAMQLAKVGKRMALALRADMLQPFDGWDLGDSIVIDIEHGAVDSSEYGSGGLWTIYGVEWRYFSDGHSELSLTVLPKKTDTPPDTDLIPSANPGVPLDWQLGYGVPSVYGEPPGTGALMAAPEMMGPATPSLLDVPLSTESVVAAHYQDLNTGCIYELNQDPDDPDYDSYFLVSCPTEGTGVPIIPDDEDLPTLPDGAYPPGFVVSWQGRLWVVSADGTTWLEQGAATPDTTPPDKPTITSLSTRLTPDADGRLVVALAIDIAHPTTDDDHTTPLTDLLGTSIEVTSDNDGNPDPDAVEPVWTNPTFVPILGPADTHAELTALAGATKYWVRASSVDIWGNKGAYSDTESIVTAKDNEAPAVPSGLTAVPGFRLVGLNWTPNTPPDFAFNQVRYAPDDGTGLAPVTDAATWANPIRIKSNTVVITDLDAGTPEDPSTDPVTPATPAKKYWFQVRTVDWSGNVATSDTDPTAVDYQTDPDAGWCAMVSETPTLIGTADLALNSLLTNMLHSGVIDASTISGGTLTISVDGGAEGIVVMNGDVKVGFWDETGLYVGSEETGLPDTLPGAASYVRVYDGGISVFKDGHEVVAITPEGINADAIVSGTMPGGHNLVKNSSFELAPFGTSTPVPKDWNVAADWTGTEQSNTNATNGSGAVSVTGVSY